MAGDWIMVGVGLGRRLEVLGIATRTGRSRFEVEGLLIEFWSWVDGESRDGHVATVTKKTLMVAIGADEAFWAAVESVGWAKFTDEGLEVPNWGRWNTSSTKIRLQATLRKRRSRLRKENPPQDVTQMSRINRDQSVSREERIEKITSPPPPPRARGGGEGEKFDVETEKAWAVYREQLDKRTGPAKVQDPIAYLKALRAKHRHPREVDPKIDQTMAKIRELEEREDLLAEIRSNRMGIRVGDVTITEDGLRGPRGLQPWSDVTLKTLRKIARPASQARALLAGEGGR